MKNIFYSLILVLGISAQVQGQDKETTSASETQKIQAVIDTFFEGLEQGDTVMIASILSKDIILESAFKNREGVESSTRMTRDQIMKGLGSKKAADIWEERLGAYSFHVDANLASVWVPYSFYLNKEFSHCGSNSFQMVRRGGTWEIVYIIDVRKRSDCKKS
ncbi:MAG: nuclear transport factor 2 family protein [Flavobacteriaceae bacterium]